MGHGQKNQSRHQQMVSINARVATLAGAVKGLAETLAKEDKARVKRFAEIEEKADWLADELADEHTTTLRRLNALTNIVEFNALPFWKRWWRTWRAAATTVALMPEPTADADDVIFPPEMNMDYDELARFKAGYQEHLRTSHGRRR